MYLEVMKILPARYYNRLILSFVTERHVLQNCIMNSFTTQNVDA